MSEPLNVSEYEALARERLAEGPYGYFAGGAGDEWTLAENVRAFNRWVLRPRMLVDIGTVTTATSVLGADVSMPILIAPTAFQRLAHPEGETATARAAATAGTVFCLSTLGSYTPAEIAASAPEGTNWLQLYWSPDRGFTQALVEASAAAGFGAILLTVDLPLAGRRERDLRAAFELPADLSLPNLPSRLGGGNFHAALAEVVDRTITWRDLEWLASLTDLPLVVKGILTAEDGRLACEHGAAGVVVSNHGGRQLDGVAASIDALPEVVDACAGRVTVLLDGGVRRGTDVVKAIALGARAVLVGRAPVWGLAVAGEEGVRNVLELLREELALALALLGCPSPEAVTPTHIARAGYAY
jgi:isopentenyl diphosphate isomerase/L-lactate dehydrogenase-like FMN-dependent dehydrogenase